ncbi:MAG: glycosyltransferase [Halodesulfurarchaeum sp.]
MDDTIALAHAPEGAGNATRMLAVATALETRGADVAMAGGGPGARFIRMNGFEEFEPATLDFIARREAPDPGLVDALGHAIPRVIRRTADFFGWLRRVDPELLLTDDPFAAIPATALGIPFYRIDHAAAGWFDDHFERIAFRLFNGFSLRLGAGFFFTSVLEDPAPTTPNVIPVGPIAHEPADHPPVDPFDVLVIPGTYSEGFSEIADRLETAGRTVTLVGGPDWEAVPSMFPYAAAADVVVCTGFSSIAEAAVAGTPCVVYPFIDAQRGVAERIEREGVRGIEVVHDVAAAVETALDPPDPPTFENGADDVADHLVSDLV